MRGLYVHIPFCVRKCNYCDFASFSDVSDNTRREYINQLIFEIEEYKREEPIKIDTVYFGGGTPSLLSPSEFSRITSSIRKVFSLSCDTELTLEVNPGTLTEENLKGFIDSGVNRVSIGMQSIHENELKNLGRIHTFLDFQKCYEMVLKSGIDNISVDLMYRIPSQTIKSLNETLSYLLKISPSHISAYSLILEEGTPFFDKRDSLILPSEDEECEMYRMICETLAKGGYNHYEISNYAKDGKEARHNTKYWQGEEYIGVGLSAYSYFEGVRFGNSRKLSEYLSESNKDYRVSEVIEDSDRAFEYAMLKLRLSDGFSLSEYSRLFGVDFLDGHGQNLNKYIEGGYLEIKGDRIHLTESGFYISNTILSDIL